MIFSEALLQQLAVDAEQQINQDLPCIFSRVYLETIAGQSVYTLPSYVRSILRITWKGRKLDPTNWEDLQLITPATAVISETTKVEGSQGRPLFYAMHPTNKYDIRLYPTPYETFVATGDPYSPAIEDRCIITCLRAIDTSSPITSLPKYIDRRTRKAYVLAKAFQAEGKGQMLSASAYYDKKYQFLISRFRSINSSCYVGKKYSIEDGAYVIDAFRYPKPILNANFERTVF